MRKSGNDSLKTHCQLNFDCCDRASLCCKTQHSHAHQNKPNAMKEKPGKKTNDKREKQNLIRTSQFNSSFRNLQFARSLHCKDLSMHVSSSQSNSSSPHANVEFFTSTGFFFVNAV